MSDLISRSALIEHMCRSCTSKCNLDDECCCSVDAVENAPAVDAVEVVRCRDCKHWKHFDHLGCTDFVKVCGLANYMVGATGYCVYGERRTEDD